MVLRVTLQTVLLSTLHSSTLEDFEGFSFIYVRECRKSLSYNLLFSGVSGLRCTDDDVVYAVTVTTGVSEVREYFYKETWLWHIPYEKKKLNLKNSILVGESRRTKISSHLSHPSWTEGSLPSSQLFLNPVRTSTLLSFQVNSEIYRYGVVSLEMANVQQKHGDRMCRSEVNCSSYPRTSWKFVLLHIVLVKKRLLQYYFAEVSFVTTSSWTMCVKTNLASWMTWILRVDSLSVDVGLRAKKGVCIVSYLYRHKSSGLSSVSNKRKRSYGYGCLSIGILVFDHPYIS